MGSSRLKGKVLKKISGKSSLEHIIERASLSKNIDDILVATSNNSLDDKIVKLCNKLKVVSYRGSEDDVLERFYNISKKYTYKNILRLTADCPLHDPDVIDEITSFFLQNNFDYVSNSIYRTFPVGLDTEIFTFESLEKSFFSAKQKEHREHVTLYINGKFKNLANGKFRVYNYQSKGNFSFLRWTLDTSDDLKRIRKLMQLSKDSYSWLNLVSKLLKIKFKWKKLQLSLRTLMMKY